MPIWRLQVSIGGDSAFPRDKAVITPHFNDAGATTDPQGLCDDLATEIASYFTQPSPHQVEVTAYDAQGSTPVDPEGYAIRNTGSFPASTMPREIALCLSFYGVRNAPRTRGRLYIPAYCAFSVNILAARPGVAQQEKVGALVPILTDLGGPDVDWCVYSRTTNTAVSVSNWWVDDEWDTIRSRGMRPTGRIVGTTSE